MTIVETKGSRDTIASVNNQEWQLRIGFERVNVNGQPGLWSSYIRNSDGSLVVNGNAAFNKDLVWFADGIQYEIGSDIIDSFTKELFITIAESMQ